MSCTNDPLTIGVLKDVTTTLELQCTPYGNASLTFIGGTLSANSTVTFKCNDLTPRISGVRRVLSQSYEVSPVNLPFVAGRKANLTIPYDQASVEDPTKLRGYHSIVDPVGWMPIPDAEYVYDQSGTRLLYMKVPSFGTKVKFVIVEENA